MPLKAGIAVFVVVNIVMVAVDVAEISGCVGDGTDIGISRQILDRILSQADMGGFGLIIVIDSAGELGSRTKF